MISSSLLIAGRSWRSAFALRRGATLIFAVVAASLGALATPALAAETTQPSVQIRKVDTSLFIDGDCNNPAVWIGGKIRVYGSPYPQNGSRGGVATYKTGSSVLGMGETCGVRPDRSLLMNYAPSAFGPWFESIVADDAGVLWAYYHAEFPNGEETKVHPRIGAQVSYDSGETWKDLGVILDTPAGTDDFNSWLGYGFSGGNGDFSVMLDPQKEYLYFYFSQYGGPAENQGLAVARMRWTDRANPAGNVQKFFDGSWNEPGIGGRTSPLLANIGDAHAKRAEFDFWWGPSIHWNTHLQRYVILLNRSNTGDFTFQGGVCNYYMTGTRLDDPSSWDAPQPLPLPEGYEGSWYPQVIGTGALETDQLAGRCARLFVHGFSQWEITFLRPEELNPNPPVEPPQPPVAAKPEPYYPVVKITVGAGLSDVEVAPGTALTIASTATDRDGDMFSHWLEIQRPSGQWSWEGWLFDEPWAGTISGTGFKSTKSGVFTFDDAGTYTIRSSAIDSGGLWITSTEVRVHVGASPLPRVQIALNGQADGAYLAQGTALNVQTRATDATGDMAEHWLEILSPDGVWSWNRGSTDGLWTGALLGDGSASEKSALTTFDQTGTYLLRASAVDRTGQWVTSAMITVKVVAAE